MQQLSGSNPHPTQDTQKTWSQTLQVFFCAAGLRGRQLPAPGGSIFRCKDIFRRQTAAFSIAETASGTRRSIFRCGDNLRRQAAAFSVAETVFMQSDVHHHTILIVQRGLWCGQSEHFLRLSTSKRCREYLVNVSVDNELQVSNSCKKMHHASLSREKKVLPSLAEQP